MTITRKIMACAKSIFAIAFTIATLSLPPVPRPSHRMHRTSSGNQRGGLATTELRRYSPAGPNTLSQTAVSCSTRSTVRSGCRQ